MDFTASILAITGAAVPPEARLEGVDLFPVWEGRQPEFERTLFWRAGEGPNRQVAVRRGDWKLLIDGMHGYVFNVRTDLGERNDLAKWRQDIAQELQPLIAEWEASVDADRPEQPAATGAEPRRRESR
jgi:hypothetical protein